MATTTTNIVQDPFLRFVLLIRKLAGESCCKNARWHANRWKKYASLYRMTHYVLFIPIFSIGLQLVFLPSSTRGVLLPSSPLRHWRSRNTLRFFGYANRAKLKPVRCKASIGQMLLQDNTYSIPVDKYYGRLDNFINFFSNASVDISTFPIHFLTLQLTDSGRHCRMFFILFCLLPACVCLRYILTPALPPHKKQICKPLMPAHKLSLQMSFSYNAL